jgi:5-(carboxyamino)imidazole ribonucleotide mutase
MGSTSDWPVMEDAARFLNDLHVPFEINALSAHRATEAVVAFARGLHLRGVKVVVAGAGGAAHLPGVVAALTPLPVVGVPIRSANSTDGWDSILSILQMPAGIPVATVALNGARNAGILAAQILATADTTLFQRIQQFKAELAKKVVDANDELGKIAFAYRVRAEQ